jgi:hypothetical protein
MTDNEREARVSAYIDEIVAAAPPLTEAQAALVVRCLGPAAKRVAEAAARQ